MSLTFFITLCVLGCDFLIYFLYRWALGERRRTLMRKASSRQRAEALANPQPHPRSTLGRPVAVRRANERSRPVSVHIPNRSNEELAYRRVAASFAPLKPRT
jgi:hypothetical protein